MAQLLFNRIAGLSNTYSGLGASAKEQVADLKSKVNCHARILLRDSWIKCEYYIKRLERNAFNIKHMIRDSKTYRSNIVCIYILILSFAALFLDLS